MEAATTTKKVKSDPNDHRNLTPFFLQDPYDGMCLGPNGFTNCDESVLWILTKRAGRKTYSLVSFLNPSKGICLQRKTTFFGLFSSDKLVVGPCGKTGAKSWEVEFVDQLHMKISNRGQCLVRGKKGYKNSASLQSCSKGEFLPLVYHPTAVHENGFYLKAADGTCFDGSKFRPCTGSGSGKLLWGLGVKYSWGEALQYIYNFSVQDRTACIVRKGSKVEKGICGSSGYVPWGLQHGQLSTQHGQKCLIRKADDTAGIMPCSEASEYIAIEVPSAYTNEQLAQMLKNPVSWLLYQ